MRPALPSSIDELLHDTGIPALYLRTDRPDNVADILRTPRLERAIGVIYQPGTERQSHYFHTRMADRFDAVIHIDRTTALQPLVPDSTDAAGAVPETYPSGL